MRSNHSDLRTLAFVAAGVIVLGAVGFLFLLAVNAR